MSLWSRLSLLLHVKGTAALERAEDPREVLGYADEQQQELLRRVKQGLIEVAISKRQLQQQVATLDARVPRLEDQAKRALAAGREDLARLALERKQRAFTELESLEPQVAEVRLWWLIEATGISSTGGVLWECPTPMDPTSSVERVSTVAARWPRESATATDPTPGAVRR